MFTFFFFLKCSTVMIAISQATIKNGTFSLTDVKPNPLGTVTARCVWHYTGVKSRTC